MNNDNTQLQPASLPSRFQLIRHGSSRAWCFELRLPEGDIELDFRGEGSREEVAIHQARLILANKFGETISQGAEFDIGWFQPVRN